MKIKYLFLIAFFINGCSFPFNQKTTFTKTTEPEWILNPLKYSDGKLVAVGCANRHYKGVEAQKKLAIKRAIDEIAMQKETMVNKISLREKKVSGRVYSSSLDEVSLQNVKNVKVSSKIKDWYKYPNGKICVLVVGQ